MNDLKKTFFAGFVVLLILLLTPYYLQLIGYQNTNIEKHDIETGGGAGIVTEPLKSIVPLSSVPIETRPAIKDPEVLQIESAIYRASISTVGGGSFQEYTL